MKEEHVPYVSVITTILIFTGAIVFLLYARVGYNSDCLEGYAKDYCLENNYSDYEFWDNSIRFICIAESNERTGVSDDYFYYLEEEKAICETKESNSWGRKK